MTAARLQAALAYMLVSNEARADLRHRPDRVQEKFSLSPAELTQLRSIPAERMNLTAEAVDGKRVLFLHRVLPLTMRLIGLAGQPDAVVRSFLVERLPLASEENGNRLLAEGARFVDFLSVSPPAGLPAYVSVVATFEFLRMQLSFSSEASLWAERCAKVTSECLSGNGASVTWPDGVSPELGRHVRLESYPYDVVPLLEAIRVAQEVPTVVSTTTHVAMKKCPQRPAVSVYRLDADVHQVLASSDGSRDAGALSALRVSPRCDVRKILSFALREQFFVLHNEKQTVVE